jgi:hypothetical protein
LSKSVTVFKYVIFVSMSKYYFSYNEYKEYIYSRLKITIDNHNYNVHLIIYNINVWSCQKFQCTLLPKSKPDHRHDGQKRLSHQMTYQKRLSKPKFSQSAYETLRFNMLNIAVITNYIRLVQSRPGRPSPFRYSRLQPNRQTAPMISSGKITSVC